MLGPSVRLLRTPGHSAEDITTLAAAADGSYACTHAWWGADGPADDPFAPDREVLRASRERILGLASVIIPGHGPAFRPDERTPASSRGVAFQGERAQPADGKSERGYRDDRAGHDDRAQREVRVQGRVAGDGVGHAE